MFVKKHTWVKHVVLFIVASLIISACVAPAPQGAEEPQPAAEPEQPAVGGTVTIGMPAGFDTLDPNVTTFTRVARIALHMTDPWIWQVEPGVFAPGLATEWSVNEDATEYRFKFREDVTFHDGTPFNAEAIKFTLDRIADPATKSQIARSMIGAYEETEVINDYEVVVRFSSPYAPFLDSVSQPYLAPVSPTAVQEAGEEAWGMTTFVGTGPFKFESMVLNEEVVLARNPDYNWGPEEFGMEGPPSVEKLVFKFIQEPSTRTAALLTDEIDFLDEVLAVDFKNLEENPDITTVQMPQPGLGYALMFNHQKPPTDELAVRRAMQLAMDKQGMVDTVFNGFGEPACSLLTKVVYGFCSETCEMYTQDLEAARQVLEEAGWVDTDGDGIRERDGEPLVIGHYYRADAGLSNEIAAFMKDNFAKIGIDVQLNGLSRSGYFDAVRSGQHNTQGWLEWATDPDLMLRGVLHSSNAGGGTNRNNLMEPEIDQMIERAGGEVDPEKRADLYCDLLKKVKEGAHMEIWVDPVLLYAHDANLEGIVYYQSGNYPYFAAASISN